MFYLSDESIFLFLLFCKATDDIGPTTSSLLNILIAWNFHHHHQRRPLPEQNPVYITIILDGGILYIQIYSYKCKRKIIFCQIYNQTSEGVKKIHQEHAQYIYMKLEKKHEKNTTYTTNDKDISQKYFPSNVPHLCMYIQMENQFNPLFYTVTRNSRNCRMRYFIYNIHYLCTQ